ncbi:DsbA family protein [Sphingorhabdus sp. EL138]|uniref:DsbA family protein n=1 Tax=Sphingorhabdus sp. EL138 TaxID=2073156 RepID=UPI0020B11952|nr:DsbA family protein [Sphingorhabdus sp. EL138]
MIMAGGGLAIAAAAAVWFMQTGGTSASDETAQAALAAGIDGKQQAAIEAIVRDYILKNPEIIPEAVEILQTRQKTAAIDEIRSGIEAPFAGAAFAGNPNGDVIIVEYSDFACPYCKQTTADIDRLLKEDKNIKVVFRELPILSEASNDAALMALAAAKQGKYYAFHKTMFATGRPTPSTIESAAKEVGLDMAAARKFIATPEAQRELQNNIEVARKLQFTGTPAFVVGNQTEVGAVGYDGIKDMIAKARGSK